MANRDKIVHFATKFIDKYDTDEKKNRVCIFCGFENTVFKDEVGHCNVCNRDYKLIETPIITNSSCCIIS